MPRQIIRDVITKKENFKSENNPISLKNEKEFSKKLDLIEFLKEKKTKKNAGDKEKIPVFGVERHLRSPWWKRKSFWGWAGGSIFVFGSIFIFSAWFSSATIQISPRTASIPLKSSFVASKKPGNGNIPFEVTVVKGSEEKVIPAESKSQVNKKASGQIVVYNNYSSVSQKLVSGTRFQASSGKIYRIKNEIIVPGTREKDGEIIPGSIETSVYADQAGDSYNTGLTDFTIPGFKGDPRYDKFYARSKTEITGGFSGVAPTASEKDLSSGKNLLIKSLEEDLFKEASSQVPEDYILYRGASKFSFTESSKPSENGGDSVVLREDGVMVGLLLKKDSLISRISENISDKSILPESPFYITNLENLIFSFPTDQLELKAETQTINFNLTGGVSISYKIDEEAVISSLFGQPKDSFQSIIGKYPTIASARIFSWRPFWGRKFPVSPDNLKIQISLK